MSVSFAELLQSAEQLNADTANATSLPRVHRNLGQIAEAGERLWMKTAAMATDDSADVKASILLGSRGFDVPSMSQKMETLKSTTIEPTEVSQVTDIQGFLKGEREQALLGAIIESKNNTMKSAAQRHSQALQQFWEEEKERVLSALLGSTKTDFHVPVDIQPLSVSNSYWGTNSAMSQDELSFADVINRRNDAVIAGRRYPLIDEFMSTINEFGESKAVLDCWELVEVLVNSNCFDDPMLRFKASNSTDLVKKSVEYLEKGFQQFVQTTICGHLEQAELGGVPGIMELATSYLSVRTQESSVWGLVFVCLRCGSPAAALQALQDDGYEGEIESILENWSNFSQPSIARDKVRQLYYGGVNNCSDPYKRLVFSILGGCDIDRKHGDILTTVQDYIWLKLVHVLTCSSSGKDFRSSKDKITLSEVQEHVLQEYGENHFNSLQSPYLYALVLLLTGLYEPAIEVLYRNEESRANAIHLALALHSNGMINLSVTPHQPVLCDEDPAPHKRLNLSRIIIGYTRKFACSNPISALNYYYILHGIHNEDGEDMFAVCIADLIQESKEYQTLLGTMDSSGRKTKGAIDRFNVNHSQIISTVAEASEKRGCWQEAVTLYELAHNYDKVLEILNEELSRKLMPNDKAHDHIHEIATGVETRLQHSNSNLRKQFLLLLDLYQFHKLYHSGTDKLEEALDVISRLQIIPLQQDAINHRVQSFKSFSDELRRCIPDILIMVMSILNKLFKNTSKSNNSYSGQNKPAQKIRDQAKVVMRFAGMLPYSMPGDTHAQLSMLDAPMRY